MLSARRKHTGQVYPKSTTTPTPPHHEFVQPNCSTREMLSVFSSTAAANYVPTEHSVTLRVYDISDGIASTWSPILLGRQIEGIWHTGVLVFGFEYFYGGGIVKMRPETVEKSFGITPVRLHHLGSTAITIGVFETYLLSIMEMFRKECYDLISWNCNNFSDHIVEFLLKRTKSIPPYIMDLPQDVSKTFMGKLILSFIKMVNGAGTAPIELTDPSHPRQILSAKKEQRPRTTSCPPSPTTRTRTTSAMGSGVESSYFIRDPPPPSSTAAKTPLFPKRSGRRHSFVAMSQDENLRPFQLLEDHCLSPSKRAPNAPFVEPIRPSPKHQRDYHVQKRRMKRLMAVTDRPPATASQQQQQQSKKTVTILATSVSESDGESTHHHNNNYNSGFDKILKDSRMLNSDGNYNYPVRKPRSRTAVHVGDFGSYRQSEF